MYSFVFFHSIITGMIFVYTKPRLFALKGRNKEEGVKRKSKDEGVKRKE